MFALNGLEWVVVLGLVLSGPVLVALVVAVAIMLGRRRTPAATEAAEAARRHGGWVHLGAWAALLLGPWVVLLALPAMAMTTAGVAGGTTTAVLAGGYLACPALAFLGVHALGERAWPRPSGPVRRAALVPRRSPAPRRLASVTIGWATAMVVVLVVTAGTATDGRRLVRGPRVADGYPGWPFGLSLVVALAVVGLATRATLRLVARRPAITGDDAFDDASRRLTAHRVLRGVQLVLAIGLAAVLGFTASALTDVGLDGPGAALRVIAGVVAVAGLVVAALPARPATPGTWAPQVVPGAWPPPPGIGTP